MPETIHIIAGPTASGKSALALQMAQEKNGVIINADSMQIYNALPILTAQPSADDRQSAPHRLYGTLQPDQPCSAAQWRSLAIAEIETALANNQTPIVTGGTGLYIGALIYGLSPMPDVPPEIRAEAMRLQSERGNPGFHAELEKIDPAMAGRLHPNDTQRLIRAWEVMTATGQSLNDWQAEPREAPPEGWSFHVTLVLPDREILYSRCNTRFDHMLQNGALDEVAAFDCTGTYAVENALGYRALKAHTEGRMSLEDAVTTAKTETRQYAKRQVTWFRHQLKHAEDINIIQTIC
jgi:tRNA dimethylallyltransferase